MAVSLTTRFILAKYAPDLDRMEPRNIGVILWANGKMASRFLTESEAITFVESPETYRRWVAYWSAMIDEGAIEPRRGKSVAVDQPAAFDAFLSTQDGNYILVDSGELLENIRKRDINVATDFLYKELVSIREPRSTRIDKRAFDRKCLDVLEASGIAHRSDFRSKYTVPYQVNGVEIPVHFSYGIGQNKPTALMQRANLTSEDSITSSVGKIQSVFQSGLLKKQQCVALYRKSDIKTPNAELGHQLLSSLCDAVDVESKEAKDRLAAIAPSASA